MLTSHADAIWNRALTTRREDIELEVGDLALGALLRAHGLVMNGGVGHCVESLGAEDLGLARDGYSYFDLREVATLLGEAEARLATWSGSDEVDFDSRYDDLIPNDDHLFERFTSRLAARPADFAAVDELPGSVPGALLYAGSVFADHLQVALVDDDPLLESYPGQDLAGWDDYVVGPRGIAVGTNAERDVTVELWRASAPDEPLLDATFRVETGRLAIGNELAGGMATVLWPPGFVRVQASLDHDKEGIAGVRFYIQTER